MDEGAETRRMTGADRKRLRQSKTGLLEKFELPEAGSFSEYLRQRAEGHLLRAQECVNLGNDISRRWIVKLDETSIGVYTIFTAKSGQENPDKEYAGKIPDDKRYNALTSIVLSFSESKRKDTYFNIPFP